MSAVLAALSWRASQSSASAARRSAAAAEESVEIQKREAQAAEETRKRAQLADVVPLYWDGRSGQIHRGLVIRNNGPAVAREITAYEMLRGGSTRKWLWPTLAPGETRGLLKNEQPVSDEEAVRIGRPPDEDADSHARLEWINANGSGGLVDWRAIQHR